MKLLNNLVLVSAFIVFTQSSLFCQDSLIISEIMAINNATIQDEDGTYSDWIEIYNGGSESVNLFGWCLTDDSDNFYKWPFPDITIDAKEYIIVFASDKNRRNHKDSLHTNFKLSGSGEFLALSNPVQSKYNSVFTPSYPEQYDNVSYAYHDGRYIYSSNPTPGGDNDTSIFITPPRFGKKHGFYDESFMLEILSEQSGVDIYYTTDASTPSITNGILYTEPLDISSTTTVRAIAVTDSQGKSVTTTASYIFLEDVLEQSENQPGYPDTWLSPINEERTYFEIPTHYGMDQNLVGRDDVKAVIHASLKSLPVISIVTDVDHLFSKSTHADSGGIYMYSGEPDGATRELTYHLGRGWERPASVEYFNSNEADGELDFQENCAIKIHGGASRSTRKTVKRSFKLGFKSEYGPTKLKEELFGDDAPDQYDWLILRGGFDRRLGQQIYDPWAKSAYRDMGQYAANSKFVHVYLNGMYWGMYNLSEQMDENCMRDNLGGDEDDYDIVKDYYEVEAGDTVAWDSLVAMAANNITDPANYQKLLGNNADGTPNPEFEKMLNAENLIDYMLMNMYCSMGDWDHHNWMAARREKDSEGFHFLVWDAERSLGGGNIVDWIMSGGNENRPTGVFSDLMTNQQFRNLFISRVNKHYFEEGALIPENGLERYKNWLNEIDTALIADQTRWVADYNDIWNESYHEYYLNNYFPGRTEYVFTSFVNEGIYPEIEEPVFNTDESEIPEDFELLLSIPEGSEVRYTIDGTDPGHYHLENTASIMIYDGSALTIPDEGDEITISARTKKDTLWSTLVRETFTIENEITISTDESLAFSNNFYNYPNPMKDYTNIAFTMSETAHVRLKIYNTMGELMDMPLNAVKQGGEHNIIWYGEELAPGIYFCILDINGSQQQIKILKE